LDSIALDEPGVRVVCSTAPVAKVTAKIANAVVQPWWMG
jgi:hypothetical protein